MSAFFCSPSPHGGPCPTGKAPSGTNPSELASSDGSAEYLWCDVVGADRSEQTITVKLRGTELPLVRMGDAARIFIKRYPPNR